MSCSRRAERLAKLCKVTPGEKVVVFADTLRDERIVDAFYMAASSITSTVGLLTDPFPVLTNPPEICVKAMCEADIVFDLASHHWLYTEATDRILAAKTRMLQVTCNSPEVVVARPPEISVLEREGKAHKLLAACKNVRITSAEGTDIRLGRGDRPIHTQGGSVDRPGTWDS